jgi:plasmid stabilization system protein ParE
MIIPVRVVTPARRDVVEIAKYLVARDARLAARFWRAVKTTLDRLGKSPDLGEL